MAAALTVMVIGLLSSLLIVMAGLDPAIHPFSRRRWTRGSSPRVTKTSEIHLVAALEHQDLARLVGRRDLQPQPLDDLARLGDLLGVRLGELAGADPERVLQSDAYV